MTNQIPLLAIHKMTERTLAASPNLDGNHRQRSGTDNETSPNATQVQKILPQYPHLISFI
jgi:hypothetical protein